MSQGGPSVIALDPRIGLVHLVAGVDPVAVDVNLAGKTYCNSLLNGLLLMGDSKLVLQTLHAKCPIVSFLLL